MATQLNNKTSKKSLAYAVFQWQVQTAIAVSCMAWVHSLDQMKLQQVYQKLHESYHGMVIIAQAENRADQRSHECGMLALSQVIESKQKRVASLTKLLEIPGMEAGQKTQILEKIMELMADIQDKENIMEQKSENKRKPSDLIDGFL